ncbi:MAG: hypothetical protein WCJ29_03740 [bacterium]
MKIFEVKNSKYLVSFLVGLVGILAILGFVLWNRGGAVKKPIIVAPPKVETENSRLEVAQVRAREWNADAVLSKVSLSSDAPDRAIYEFSSLQVKNKVLSVIIDGSSVTSAEEIAAVVTGGEVPSNLIGSDEAITKVLSIKGYEEAKIFGVEMIYGPDGKQWYWGVKTDKGVVSIKATK